MIEQEYILLIMNCKKYLKKAKYQKMTWLPKLPSYLSYYHVIGDTNLDTKYKFDNDSKILWLNVPDDYNSLPKKVIRAYEAINETFNVKYIFKTDDDQILANDKFIDIVKNILDKKSAIYYGGYIVDVKHNYLSQYNKIHPELPAILPIRATKYCSGRFYFLSKSAMSNLISKKHLIEKEYLEDYAIGFYLDPIYKRNMLHLATNKYFTDIELSNYSKLIEEGKL
jgi:hypothetical protein